MADWVGVVVAVVVALSGGAWALVRIGIWIKQAERDAKHGAIEHMSAYLSRVQSECVDCEVYRAEQDGLRRRLEVIERRLGLDGSKDNGPTTSR